MTEENPNPQQPSLKGGKGPKKGSFMKGVAVGAASVVGLAAFVDSDRYPIRVEYEIAKTCIDGGSSFLSREAYLKKQERCICALEKTMRDVSYDVYEKSVGDFISKFREHSPTCAKEGRS